MTKTATQRTVSTGRLSATGELRVLRKVAEALKKDPTLLRETTVSAGIYTKDGRLRKAFGGTAR
ncbi:MAG: hypothetical protein IT468_01665 [Rhodocyclaceae bacterium]|nr:hypothetical protein [Rhodocyclaceae bacterium]